MKRIVLLSLVAVSLLGAAPAKRTAQKHGTRIPGVLNAATYPGRHPVKTVKPFYKAGKRVLW